MAPRKAKPHQERAQAVGSDFLVFWIISDDSSAAWSPSPPPQPPGGAPFILPSNDISLGGGVGKTPTPLSTRAGGGRQSSWPHREGLGTAVRMGEKERPSERTPAPSRGGHRPWGPSAPPCGPLIPSPHPANLNLLPSVGPLAVQTPSTACPQLPV